MSKKITDATADVQENALAYIEISKEVYDDDGGAPAGWKKVLRSDELPEGTFVTEGFYGCLYKRETLNASDKIVTEYAIAYRGGEYTDMSDGLSSTQIMTDQIPNQLVDAFEFVKASIRRLEEDDIKIESNEFTYTGHGLGGALAQMVGIVNNASNIWTYNALGGRTILNDLSTWVGKNLGIANANYEDGDYADRIVEVNTDIVQTTMVDDYEIPVEESLVGKILTIIGIMNSAGLGMSLQTIPSRHLILLGELIEVATLVIDTVYTYSQLIKVRDVDWMYSQLTNGTTDIELTNEATGETIAMSELINKEQEALEIQLIGDGVSISVSNGEMMVDATQSSVDQEAFQVAIKASMAILAGQGEEYFDDGIQSVVFKSQYETIAYAPNAESEQITIDLSPIGGLLITDDYATQTHNYVRLLVGEAITNPNITEVIFKENGTVVHQESDIFVGTSAGDRVQETEMAPPTSDDATSGESGTNSDAISSESGTSDGDITLPTIQITRGGDDILTSTVNNDFLYGGKGNDAYVFDASGYGHDVIEDPDNGYIVIGTEQLSGIAQPVEGEIGVYALNGQRLTISENGKDLLVTNPNQETIIIKNWQPGQFGISLGLPTIKAPDIEFDDWGSDNGVYDFGSLRIDGTLDVPKMAIDMDVDMGQLLELPNLNMDASEIGVSLGIDLSGMAASVVNGFLQGIIDGILNSLKETIFNVILQGIVQIVASIFIPIVGWASAALAYANMAEKIVSIFNTFKDAYDEVESIYNKVKSFQDKVEATSGSISSIFDMIDEMDNVWLEDNAPEDGIAHEVSTGDGDDVIYTTNYVDHIDAGADNDRVYSMGGDDNVALGEGDNFAELGAGNDTATAGAGDDIIYGFSGDDVISAGDGDNQIDGGMGNDTITTGSGDDFVNGGSGNDIINTGDGNDTIKGDHNDDVIDAGAGNDTIDAGTGNDHVIAGSGDDTVQAGEGDDTVLGGTGNDTLYGQAGNDVIDGEEGDDNIHGGSGDDTISGGLGNDIILGGLGDDTLMGGAGDDRLYGGENNDVIAGGAGHDTLSGGAGRDTFELDSTESQWDEVTDYEDGMDTINVSATAGAQYEAAYADVENHGYTHNQLSWKISGTDSDDIMLGDGNNDRFYGSVGADAMVGGDGNDTADYTESAEAVTINLETKEAVGGDATGDTYSSIESITGTAYDDVFVGDDSANTFEGNAGDDTFIIGRGYDHVRGGAGVDQFIIQRGMRGDIVAIHDFNAFDGEQIDLSAFDDVVRDYTDLDIRYESGNATVVLPNGQIITIIGMATGVVGPGHFVGNASIHNGDANGNTLWGGAWADTMAGNDGDDRLVGGSGDDVLDGGAGSDIIEAGTGSDTLIGGTGSDTFKIEAQLNNDDADHVVIRDFNVSEDYEKIMISGYGATDSAETLLSRATDTETGTLLHLLDGKTIELVGVDRSALTSDHLIVGDAAIMAAEINQKKAAIAAQVNSQQAAVTQAVNAAKALELATQKRLALNASIEATEAAIAEAKEAERVANIAKQQADSLAAIETQKVRESQIGLSFDISTNGRDMGDVSVVKMGDYEQGDFLLAKQLAGKDVVVRDFNGDSMDDIQATDRLTGDVTYYESTGLGFKVNAELAYGNSADGVEAVAANTAPRDDTASRDYYLSIESETPTEASGIYGDFNGDGVEGELDFQTAIVFENASTLNALTQNDTLIGDFNGDGNDDILSINSGSGQVLQIESNGDSFKTVRQLGRTLTQVSGDRYVGDFNGDGLDDVMIDTVDGQMMFFSNGSGFEDGVLSGQYDASTWYIGDYNGDGLDDTMRVMAGQANVILSWRAEDGDTGFMRGGMDNDGVQHEFDQRIPELVDVTSNTRAIYGRSDVNGDGKDDLVFHRDDLGDESGIYSYLSTGSGFEDGGQILGAAGNHSEFTYGDFDGDGFGDMFQQQDTGSVDMIINQQTMDGAPLQSVWLDGLGEHKTWQVGDFNGDGKDDIIAIGQGNADVYLSTGDAFENANTMVEGMDQLLKVDVADHRYMTAWVEYGSSRSETYMYARFFNQYGEALSDPVLIDQYTRSPLSPDKEFSIKKIAVDDNQYTYEFAFVDSAAVQRRTLEFTFDDTQLASVQETNRSEVSLGNSESSIKEEDIEKKVRYIDEEINSLKESLHGYSNNSLDYFFSTFKILSLNSLKNKLLENIDYIYKENSVGRVYLDTVGDGDAFSLLESANETYTPDIDDQGGHLTCEHNWVPGRGHINKCFEEIDTYKKYEQDSGDLSLGSFTSSGMQTNTIDDYTTNKELVKQKIVRTTWKTNWGNKHSESTTTNSTDYTGPFAVPYKPVAFDMGNNVGILYQVTQGDAVQLKLDIANKLHLTQVSESLIYSTSVSESSQEYRGYFDMDARQLSDGRVVVVWSQLNSSGLGVQINAKLLSATGASLSTRHTVVVPNNGYGIAHIELAELSDNKFAITWSSSGGQDGSGYGVYGQLISITGEGGGSVINRLGIPDLINVETSGSQTNRDILSLADDEAVFFYYDADTQTLKGRVLRENTDVNSLEGNTELTVMQNGNYQTDGASGIASTSGIVSAAGTMTTSGLNGIDISTGASPMMDEIGEGGLTAESSEALAWAELQADIAKAQQATIEAMQRHQLAQQTEYDSRERLADNAAIMLNQHFDSATIETKIDAFQAEIDAWAAAQTVTDTAGDDVLTGQSGDDVIVATTGHDVLVGGDGNDILVSSSDGGVLVGGNGDDRFVIQQGDQTMVTIYDFSAGDVINLDGFSTVTAFEDLQFEDVTVDGEELVAVHVDADNTVIIKGVALADVNESMFEGRVLNHRPTLGVTQIEVLEDTDIVLNIHEAINDVDGDATAIVSISDGAYGVIINESGQWKYRPQANFNGEDTIRVVIEDENHARSHYQIRLNVNGVNDAPELLLETLSGKEDRVTYLAPIAWAVDIDGDALTLESVGSASHGTVEIVDDLIKYTPMANYNGTDTFEYTVSDGNGGLTTQTMTLFIDPINDEIRLKKYMPTWDVQADEAFAFTLTDSLLEDVEGDAETSIALKNGEDLPDWLHYDASTHQLSGTPDAAYAGQIIRIEITAKDAVSVLKTTIHVAIASVTGSDANDILVDTVGDDIVRGGSGNDELISGLGTDLLLGGEGDDTFDYAEDALWTSSYFAYNTDTGDKVAVIGMKRSYDMFDGGDGIDVLKLTSDNDAYFLDDEYSPTQTGDGRLHNVEKIDAGAGQDIVDLSSSRFTYGDIEINGGDGNDVVWGNAGNDTLYGDAGDDNIQGGQGNDALYGGSGSDILKGVTGDDTLDGGAGADDLFGGSGADIFVFSNVDDSTTTEMDTIHDFSQRDDRIDVSQLDFNSLDDFQFTFDGTDTIVNAVDEAFAFTLSGEHHLTENDFVFA